MNVELSLGDNVNVDGVNKNGERPSSELGLSLATVTTPRLIETELKCM